MQNVVDLSRSGLAGDYRANLREIQLDALDSLYAATAAAAACLLAAWAWDFEQWRLGVCGAVLLLAAPFGYWLAGRRYALRAGCLITLWLIVAGAVVLWISGAAAPLFALPVLLAAVLIHGFAGLAAAAGATALMLAAGVHPLATPLAVTWGAAVFGALTYRPFEISLRWSWQHYTQARAELERAQETQVELKQAVADLADAGVQMGRLNKLLSAARQSAEQAERVKAEFVANVSHELRTPLNMIIGFCEMITASPDSYGWVPEALLADLAVVLRNSRHLSSLIDDVLDMSQIDAGQMALSREWSNLPEILQAATVAVRPLYESKHLSLEVEVAPDLPAVFCDPLRIREVVLNLLSNAGRFTEQGGVRVRALAQGPHVVVSVADTGPGISPEQQMRLFRPFEQLEATTRRRYGGTGLGLSISKGFVELHDGKLWVESQVGQGTTFYFRLPVEPASAQESTALRWFNRYEPYEQRDRLPAARPRRLRPRVAVVERGNTLRHLIERYVDGVDVAPFTAVEDALDDLDQVASQLLIVNAPGIEETLARLSAERRGLPEEVPALICSIPEVAQTAQAYGAAAYLLKPITGEALLGALDALGVPLRTVLVVDDEPDALQLFKRMLLAAHPDCRVLTASDGQAALDTLRATPADAIVLDLVMPGMDGPGFLAARQAEAGLRDIPVILATAQDPHGRPMISTALTVTRAGGLSAAQLVACVGALTRALGDELPAVDRGSPAASRA